MRYDVYGCMGKAFNNDLDKVGEYLIKVADACAPYEVFVEMPVDMKSNEKQLEAMKYLRKYLDDAGCRLKLIIDEYANTYEEIVEWVDAKGADMVQVKTIDLGGINNIVEADLYCKAHGVLAYQGGTCNQTDKAAIVCANLAVATKPFAMGRRRNERQQRAGETARNTQSQTGRQDLAYHLYPRSGSADSSNAALPEFL